MHQSEPHPRRQAHRLLALLLVALAGMLAGAIASRAAVATPRIEGYASADGVAQGGTLELHVSTVAESYSVVIEDALDPAAVLARFDDLHGAAYAVPESAFAWGCGWPVALAVPIPTDWPSAVYYARLVASAPADTSFVPFVVLEDEPGSTSPILVQLSTATANAYNAWGGRSLYPQNSQQGHRSYFVSTQRPYDEERGKGQFPWWERPLAAWLRVEGIPVEYCTNLQLHRDPGLLAPYKLFVSVGHDEYWSKEMYDQAEAFREAGGNLAFFSGNAIFWCVRFQGDTMVCYKDLNLDPYYAQGIYDQVTVNWRSYPLNRPEGRLIGVQFDSWCWRPCGVPLRNIEPRHWTARGLGLTYDVPLGTDTVGYEWDRVFSGAAPAGLQVLFNTAILNHSGNPRYQQGTYYEYPPGEPRSRVFAGGTIQWSWGVRPDSAGADSNLVRITRRIVRCLSQPPGTASDREVIFTADLRHQTLPPQATIWLRGSPPPLDPAATNFPMLDDGVYPDSVASDRIYTRAVTFPAGSWDIVNYNYWTTGVCVYSLLSAWIEDPDLGPGPTVRLARDRLDLCPEPTSVAGSGVPPAPGLEVTVRPADNGVRIAIVATAARAARVPLRVAIYDVLGRLTRIVASGTLAAERTELLWDGEDGSGRTAPAGVYLVQVRAGEAERIAKIVW